MARRGWSAVLLGLGMSFAMALTLSPSPAHAATSEAAVVERILTKSLSGRTLDYAKAVKAAGRGNESYAKDVATGALLAGGTVTHASRALVEVASRMDGSAVVSTAAVSTGQGKTFGVLKVPTGGSLACKGTNSLTQHVWGFVLSLDTCNLAKFEEQTKTVGIVSGFLGIVLNQDPKLKIIVGAALALIGVGLLALNRCSKPGRGVRVYKGWAAPAQIWCKSQ